MTVKIHSALNRIIIFLIAAGMIMGLVYAAVCEKSYDTVRGFSEHRNEMSTPSLPVMPDLLADNSADVDLTRFLTERGGSGKLLDSPDDTGRADFKSWDFFSAGFCIFLLCVLPGTPFKHISYIHLKDGNK